MNAFTVRPELRAIRRYPRLWEKFARAWRSAPVNGPLLHVSADGRAHINAGELGQRMGRES